MLKIGITGQNGFVGYHLYHTIALFEDEFELIEFDRRFFDTETGLDDFVRKCDVVVHLAALNRHNNPTTIYEVNLKLVQKLRESLERTRSNAHVIMSSSTQEERDNPYGLSKRAGRELLSDWAIQSGGTFTGLVIPNIYGPFGNPFYNSVVATFCYQIARNQEPRIEMDAQLKLIYVGEVVKAILESIRENKNSHELFVKHTTEVKVSEILRLLLYFKEVYQVKGEFPALTNDFELKLFNTYRCYMDLATYFPKKFVQHVDLRGSFTEIARHGITGQTSFSTTLSGITRGNHFHTRKIERFAVIKGKARIQLRRIGTNEIHDFCLDGNEPSYVDMPIWYTHNITNIGTEPLYTIFWINEAYDPVDPDTYHEKV